MRTFRERWTAHRAMLGLPADPASLERVLAAYAEPARHYHTLQHLGECLDLFEQVAHLAEGPGEVALALWFHDAVYIPLAKDNEARSADWAGEALRAAGADRTVIEQVEALIMATAITKRRQAATHACSSTSTWPSWARRRRASRNTSSRSVTNTPPCRQTCMRKSAVKCWQAFWRGL